MRTDLLLIGVSTPLHREGTEYVEEVTRQKQQGLDPSQQGVSHTANISGHATERNVPLDTVESSAVPDVTYEHRPKTLPQNELAEREKERGLRGGATGAPSQVVASEASAGHAPGAVDSSETVHEKEQVERELLSKVTPTEPAIEAQAGSRSGPAAGHGIAPAAGSVPPAPGAIETALKNNTALESEDATPTARNVGSAPVIPDEKPRAASMVNHSLDALLPPTAVEKKGFDQPPTVLTDPKRSGSGIKSGDAENASEKASSPREHYRQDSETLPKEQYHGSQSERGQSKPTGPGKPGEKENPDAIPTAGGQKVGEQHFGESKKLPDAP